jgi:hypothetical protein
MNHRLFLILNLAIAGACAQQEEPPALDGPGDVTPTLSRVQELEQRARSMARSDGCDRLDQCATAPVGAKACGGPRTHLVYCKATTDEAELLRVLDELKRTEEAYNRAAGIGSDCAYISPPSVRLEGRSCVAETP